MNSGIKANTQNSIVFLYTVINLKRKLQKQFHLQKYKKIPLRNKFTKEMEDLYNGNYKTVVKEIKDINKWKHIKRLWIRRLHIIKRWIVPKIIYRFKAIPVKISMAFFRNRKTHSKIHMESYGTSNTQNQLKKEEKLKTYTSWLQNLPQNYSNQIVWYWRKDRYID